MLKARMKTFIENHIENVEGKKIVKVFQQEKEYIDKYQLLQEGITIVENEDTSRFINAYIERGNKETEEFLGEETKEFLQKPIAYFKKEKNEFMYMELEWFELVGVDAVSFEVDDAFGTYNVMFGLKLQKKFLEKIKYFIKNKFIHEDAKFELLFDGNEGIWNINFSLNDLEGFSEEMTIEEAFKGIYQFLFELAETADQAE
ncbi:branched-chain amino acid aminotransferase [Bacillus sp. B15-48]|uniref:branched-chain amino acid aminotransferase n=1 Tax=Bacillus sp. B15-48 TaxID=1548601 RepID=UPI00193FB6B5|nr:branched-chain amino acid aminotransferase [Bacillus sp. B15-48]MBM4761909.1 branched-chain amino acid aminotransferase [Bacillus sp. B15-48]